MFKINLKRNGTLLAHALLWSSGFSSAHADEFSIYLKPLFEQNCIKCHGGEKTKGKVNLKEIGSARDFLAKPALIKEIIEVIDAGDMPPEDEPQLDPGEREKLLAALKVHLAKSTSGNKYKRLQIRRLNRFQYNNSIRDLFLLNRDVFVLPEKLMTRESNYLRDKTGRMPDRVNVSCLSLKPRPGLKDVQAYPKDLRASHGFDNQANQLTLSPLLLDSFLKLSVSIVESPDFNEGTVGIWNDFFKEPPAGADLQEEVRKRLAPFLLQAFRNPVDEPTLRRYTAYTIGKIKGGLPFADSMKKVASAVLSSPMFLFRYGMDDKGKDQFELASRLSFFLWGSSPDMELLRLAESGELSKPETLSKTLDRMFADPRIERFLDTFPGQWMQLENVLAATPDPKKHRFFSLDKDNPASLQMVLEPLLLFDAVFIENRPIVELLSPSFNYRSDFLKTWYTSDLKPPTVDTSDIEEKNRVNNQRRKELEEEIKESKADLSALIDPLRARLLDERKNDVLKEKPVDLKPYAAWEFDGDLKSSVNRFELKAHGKVQFKDGSVILNRSYLQSGNLPIDLKAKTLEAWCQVKDINQKGGGVMGIQGPGDFFDTIVLGERKQRHWISGSNGHARTLDFPGSTPEGKSNEMLHLAMVYKADGTTTLYRNGKPYGKPYRKGAATFPKGKTSVLFGLRHLPAGGNKFLSISLDKARLYNRALTAEEVASSSSGQNLYISDQDLLQAMTDAQKAKQEALNKAIRDSEVAIKKIPKPGNPNSVRQQAKKNFDNEMRNKLRSRTFERVAASDPRYGGIITSAAMLSMTAGPKRTHPIARGAWIIEVILNDPPPPPPNDVPPLNEDGDDRKLTIREKFAKHRENPDCAGCHSRLDPLGFAMENFDITGRWRDKYENGRDVDPSGKLLRKYEFDGIVSFKESLVKENRRFAKAFAGHLLRCALTRELKPADILTIDLIVNKTEKDDFRLKSLIREVILSDRFLQLKESI
ncbi:MAG: DUF1588 domain-containing protein [Opitutae bacterium]|nr:DUF1588 domain-containing protein [Opitutae bacterium]